LSGSFFLRHWFSPSPCISSTNFDRSYNCSIKVSILLGKPFFFTIY
jgi:hypothetical protein